MYDEQSNQQVFNIINIGISSYTKYYLKLGCVNWGACVWFEKLENYETFM